MGNGKGILITGGAGFIGSHVVDLFVDNGYKVAVVDNLSSGHSSYLNDDATFYNFDINSDRLENIFLENKIDYVFHFAAQASVSVSVKNPYHDATENILGSINLLSLAKKYNVKKFVVASTAAVYGVPERLPVDELHNTACLSFYGLSKLTMEKYIELFGVDYAILRFANVYGPRQSAHGEAGVVSIFADKMKSNQEINIHGDGEQTRDFIYVGDVAKICLQVVEKDVKNEIINVSTNSAISVNQLFAIMSERFGYTKPAIHSQPREGDIKHSILDNSKCLRVLGVAPEMTLDEGLKTLIESIS